MLAIFQGRVSRGQLKHWRYGRRNPPQWAIDILRERIEELGAELARIRPGSSNHAGIAAMRAAQKQKARE